MLDSVVDPRVKVDGRMSRRAANRPDHAPPAAFVSPHSRPSPVPPTRPPSSSPALGATSLTIGALAKSANVGVETVRYYQRLRLLPTPERRGGGVRRYPATLVERIRFVKRAQDLGFTLEEVGTLLKLGDGTNRRAIRTIARHRLDDVSRRIEDLQRMQSVLTHLVDECEATGQARPCPIIAALSGDAAGGGADQARVPLAEPHGSEAA